MRNALLLWFAVPALAATAAVAVSGADDKPKYTIKEVMQKAHKGPLLKKVLSGKASQDEKDELVIGYTALSLNKPPRGEAADWKEKTEALISAAKAVGKDDKDKQALAKLKKASNCKACHDQHKGK
jgi:hypothetical protein